MILKKYPKGFTRDRTRMMQEGQLKVVILNRSNSCYLNHDFILCVPHLHTGTIVLVVCNMIQTSPFHSNLIQNILFYSNLIQIIPYNYRKRRRRFARKRPKRRPRRLKRKRNASKKQKWRDKPWCKPKKKSNKLQV